MANNDINDGLDTLLKIKELLKADSRVSKVQTAEINNQAECLPLIIEEQRRDYDYLLHIYNRLRATESVLLTAAFGIIAYLYYNAPLGDKTSIVERLFIPKEDYGKVIYYIAGSFFLYGVIKLILTVFGNNPWETVYDGTMPKDQTKGATLNHIKNRYDECHEFNASTYSKRKKNLEFLFFSILINAIILIVIKTLK